MQERNLIKKGYHEYQYVVDEGGRVHVGSVLADDVGTANAIAKQVVKRRYGKKKVHLYKIFNSDKLR